MERKHICLVTNYSNTTNYGALLQAYALNRIINRMGYVAKDLYYVQSISNKREKIIARLLKCDFKSIFNQIKSRVDKARVKEQLDKRKLIMDGFRLSIPHTEKCSKDELKKISNEFDVFICGSDQIFRPNRNTGELEEHYWLGMVSDRCVKASYAASMGIESYSPDIEKKASEYLSSFHRISMREAGATEYIKKITGRQDIITAIDPVFLLTQEEWIDLSRPYNIEERYILVYMIHGTEKLFKSIKQFAAENQLKIITFPSMSYKRKSYEVNFADIEILDADPFQFIDLIYNAEYIFTDSFHGTAFSLILHKQSFVSKANEIAFSRIANILSITHAKELIIPAEGLTADKYKIKPEVDWTIVDKCIEDERNKSVKYLKEVIEL